MNQTPFVSPLTRSSLLENNNQLITADRKETFIIRDKALILLENNPSNLGINHEIDVFNNLPIKGVSFFRAQLFSEMIWKLKSHLYWDSGKITAPFRFAELGGGEGHCARHLAEAIPESTIYVCDLSINALARARDPLLRVCADVTLPIFAPEYLDAAAFWVSLHHIPQELRARALHECYSSLRKGGVLILFEPNDAFFIRRLFYRTNCSKDVYFDEQECAVDFSETSLMAQKIGFQQIETTFLNPPYNPDFVRQLKRWRLYLFAVNFLELAGKLADLILHGKRSSTMRFFTLYGMSFFRKP